MLIQGHPRICWLENISLLDILPVVLVKPGVSIAVIKIAVAAVPKEGVHRIASETPAPAGSLLWWADGIISRALIHAHSARRVRRQHAVLHPQNIRVAAIIDAAAGAPGHDII